MRLFIFFILLSVKLSAQYFDTISVSEKIKFARYLKKNNQTEDALFLLHQLNSTGNNDSLKLMEVRLLLDLKRANQSIDLANNFLETSSDTSSSICALQLLKNHGHLLKENADSLFEPACSHIIHKDIWRIQLLSKYLLKSRFEDFEMVFNSGHSDHSVLAVIEFALNVQKYEMMNRRKKSPFLAGLLSTILPGSGKIYAGKPREALNAFLPTVFNFAQAAEGYYYKKLDSPHLYIFGTIGSVFYFSNIYGSGMAAKRKNEEYNYKVKSNIEFEISKLTPYY